MVNMIWQDEATGICVVTHEVFSRPAKLIGIVMLAPKKSNWTMEESKAVVTRYEAKLGYELQKDQENPQILRLGEVEKLCPLNHVL